MKVKIYSYGAKQTSTSYIEGADFLKLFDLNNLSEAYKS